VSMNFTAEDTHWPLSWRTPRLAHMRATTKLSMGHVAATLPTESTAQLRANELVGFAAPGIFVLVNQPSSNRSMAAWTKTERIRVSRCHEHPIP